MPSSIWIWRWRRLLQTTSSSNPAAYTSPRIADLRTAAYRDFLGGSFLELPDTEDEARKIKAILQAPDQSRPLQLRDAASRSNVLRLNDEKKLNDYLRVLETYDPQTLDLASLKQMVLAYQAKADALLASPESAEPTSGQNSPEQPAAPSKRRREPSDTRKSQALKYLSSAVQAGKVAFAEDSPLKGDEGADPIGPLHRTDGSRHAGRLVAGGDDLARRARKIASPELRRVPRRDRRHRRQRHGQHLGGQAALGGGHQGAGGRSLGPIANRFFRVWGDYYALTGDGKSARKAYNEAEAAMSTRKTYAERTAWQGADGRSTEQFLKTREFDRAIAQIRRWQDEFPADKITGYVTLMYARYWTGREKYEQALALAGQLSAVNADSPYIDQIQILASECHAAMGSPDKAIATLDSMIKTYPGSPLIPKVKERIAKLKSPRARRRQEAQEAGPRGGKVRFYCTLETSFPRSAWERAKSSEEPP